MDAASVRETARRLDAQDVSLDARDGVHRALLERLPSEAEDAEALLAEHELATAVRREAEDLRTELDPRDRAIFDERFRDEASTLAELGQRFGISRERARQLEARMLRELRARVEHRLAA